MQAACFYCSGAHAVGFISRRVPICSLLPPRSQAFMQSSLSQPSMMLSGPSLHSYPGVQAPELGKPQSSLAYQQPSSTQHIPILFEPQLNQPSGMGASQLIDTHLLQVSRKAVFTILFPFSLCLICLRSFLWVIQARQGMSQHSNLYSGQVQQHGQSSYYSNTQSPSSAMQQVKANNCCCVNLNFIFTLIFILLKISSGKLNGRRIRSMTYLTFCLAPSLGNSPPAQFPALPSKLWLRWRPASPGTAPNAPPGPAPHHQ